VTLRALYHGCMEVSPQEANFGVISVSSSLNVVVSRVNLLSRMTNVIHRKYGDWIILMPFSSRFRYRMERPQQDEISPEHDPRSFGLIEDQRALIDMSVRV